MSHRQDVIDVVREELAEDAQRIAAVAPLEDDYLRIGLWTLSWKRGLWLTILFFAALLTGTFIVELIFGNSLNRTAIEDKEPRSGGIQ